MATAWKNFYFIREIIVCVADLAFIIQLIKSSYLYICIMLMKFYKYLKFM